MSAKRPMTMTEKILAKGAGKNVVSPGEVYQTKIDRMLFQEVGCASALPAFAKLEKIGAKVWDPDKVVIIWDRFLPPSNVKAAELHKTIQKFVEKYKVNFHDMGRSGILHQVFDEQGYAVPGDIVTGTDSHTTTHGAFGAFATGVGFTEGAYVLSKGELWMRVPKNIKINVRGKLDPTLVGKDVFLYVAGQVGDDGALYGAVEWGGPVVENMNLAGRITICNMTVEIGAKNGIMAPNEETLTFLKNRAKKKFEVTLSDPDAQYDEVLDFDITGIEPQVAVPHSIDNVQPVSKVAGTKIDQAFIGSCTNGRMEDLRMAAAILKGHKVHPHVRLIVIPASQEIFQQANNEGLLNLFVDSGAVVCTPCCGPCAGINNGILGADETCISTTNRNFRGRMGDPNSKVYLSNAAVAAASALAGEIADPRKALNKK